MPGQLAALKGSMNHGRYWIVKQIGEGHFGQVYEVFDEHKQERKAAKCSRDFLFPTTYEKKALRDLHGKYGVPELYESFRHLDRFVFVIPLYIGNLDDLRQHNVRKEISWDNIRKIGHDMTLILEQIHRTGYLHRDVKPANIMLQKIGEKKGRIVLIDYNTAVKFHVNGQPIRVPPTDFLFEKFETSTWRMAEKNASSPSEDMKSLAMTLILCRGITPFGDIPVLVIERKKYLERDPLRFLEGQMDHTWRCIKVLMDQKYNQLVDYQSIIDEFKKDYIMSFDDPIKFHQTRDGCIRID